MFKGREDLGNIPNGKHNGPAEYDLDFGRSSRGLKVAKKMSFIQFLRKRLILLIGELLIMLIFYCVMSGKFMDILIKIAK